MVNQAFRIKIAGPSRRRRRRRRRKIPGIGRHLIGPTKMPFGMEILLTLLTFILLLYDLMDL